MKVLTRIVVLVLLFLAGAHVARASNLVIAVGDAFAGPGAIARLPILALGSGGNERLAGWDLTVIWDPGFATLDTVQTGGATSNWTLAHNPQLGSVSISMASPVGIDATPGGVEILALSFVMGGSIGNSTVQLSSSAVFDADLATLPHQTADGRLVIPTDTTGHLPTATRLVQTVPNPFNPATVIHFSLHQPGRATIRIFDLKGKVVREFDWAFATAGRHLVHWDGTDSRGRSVPTGLYLVRLEADKTMDRGKITLIK